MSARAVTSKVLALHERPFRIYWSGQVVSMIGEWMQTIAVSWIVLNTTHSAAALGTVLTIQFMPVLLLTFVGGALADSFPKRRMLLITQAVMCVQSCCLVVLDAAGMLNMAALCILSGILGIAQAFDNPTRHSFIPEIVSEQGLASGYALNSVAFNTAKILGPAVGGFLIERLGVGICFLFNTFSFVAALATIYMLKGFGEAGARPHRGPKGGSIREGIAYSISDPVISPIMALAAVLGIFAYNLTAIAPLIAEFVLKANPEEFGNLTAAAGIGSILAALTLTRVANVGRKIIYAGALGLGASLLLLGRADSWPANVTLLVFYGYCCIIFFTSANTFLQQNTPDDMRGRVAAAYLFCILGSTPVGSMFIGQMAQRFSVHFTLAAIGVICLTGTGLVAGMVLWKARRKIGVVAIEE
jgi:MFS family permease